MGSAFETSGRWVLDSAQEGLSSLRFDAAAAPSVQLGPEEVLVRMHAASLNYRDLVIARVGLEKRDSPDTYTTISPSTTLFPPSLFIYTKDNRC